MTRSRVLELANVCLYLMTAINYTSRVLDAAGPAAILVVEDNPALREFYRTILTHEGYSVVAVEDGRDAVQQFTQQPIGAVILDLGLPHLRGEDVSREIVTHRPVPIIVVTGSDTRHLNREYFACVLQKPVTAEVLLRAVKSCLGDA
jgi:DNA-binding response OmpR family regulator